MQFASMRMHAALDNQAVNARAGKIYNLGWTHATRRAPSKCVSSIIRCLPSGQKGKPYATFSILPERMHDVHTRSRRPAPFTNARTDCKLTFQRRFVTLCA